MTSHATYGWADEQYRAADLDPGRATFVGVKNMLDCRHGYRDAMTGSVVHDCPGPTPIHPRRLPYRRVRRPIYPLDEATDPPLLDCESRTEGTLPVWPQPGRS